MTKTEELIWTIAEIEKEGRNCYPMLPLFETVGKILKACKDAGLVFKGEVSFRVGHRTEEIEL